MTSVRGAQHRALTEWLERVARERDRLSHDALAHCLDPDNLTRWWPSLPREQVRGKLAQLQEEPT